MDRNLLKNIILDQNNYQRDIIYRKEFEKTNEYMNNEFIIIISGIRRCGKSTFLQHIRNNYNKNNYYLNFDDERLKDFSIEDFQILDELFIELFAEQETYFFDEIQNIGDVPFWVRLSIFDHLNFV
jgi:hypothetical protein